MREFSKENESEIVETPYTKMFLQNGILHYYYKEIDTMDLDMARACVEARKEFTGNKAYPCLVDVAKLHNSTKEARDYFANEGNEGIIANALLVTSSAFKMMANFYIMVNKPKNPTRLFTDKETALNWLAQFKNA